MFLQFSCSFFFRESIRTLREKGFTASKFVTRSGLFCVLWVATNYMYIHSLRILDATDVMVLYSSNVSFIYLLSWVILHEQFVGVRVSTNWRTSRRYFLSLACYFYLRFSFSPPPCLSLALFLISFIIKIVAVILCNTGIALLAYMDGLTKTPTLGGVILGAAASACSAVFKVEPYTVFIDLNSF